MSNDPLTQLVFFLNLTTAIVIVIGTGFEMLRLPRRPRSPPRPRGGKRQLAKVFVRSS